MQATGSQRRRGKSKDAREKSAKRGGGGYSSDSAVGGGIHAYSQGEWAAGAGAPNTSSGVRKKLEVLSFFLVACALLLSAALRIAFCVAVCCRSPSPNPKRDSA